MLYSFPGDCDGSAPVGSRTKLGGTFYGTTFFGGMGSHCSDRQNGSGCGTVFSVTDMGAESVLYSFESGSDGAHPQAGLLNVSGTL